MSPDLCNRAGQHREAQRRGACALQTRHRRPGSTRVMPHGDGRGLCAGRSRARHRHPAPVAGKTRCSGARRAGHALRLARHGTGNLARGLRCDPHREEWRYQHLCALRGCVTHFGRASDSPAPTPSDAPDSAFRARLRRSTQGPAHPPCRRSRSSLRHWVANLPSGARFRSRPCWGHEREPPGGWGWQGLDW